MSTCITLSEAKQHLRLDFTDDDAYVSGLCDLVDELVLTEIQGSIPGEGTVSTTASGVGLTGFESYFTDYNVGDTIKVEGETIKSIATITDDSNLTVSAGFANGASELAYIVYPGIPSPVPLGLKQAMLLMIGHFYLIREPVMIGINITEVPLSYKYLIAPYKSYTVA